MSLSDNYPDIRALWMNDYANAGVIDPRCVFTRNDSTPSNVHYWSDEDHLSSENLLLQSSSLDTSPWTTSGASVNPTSVTGPDGATSDGWTLTEDGATNNHRVVQTFSANAPSDSYALTFYGKRGTGTRYASVVAYTSTNNYEIATFDLAGGAVTFYSGSSSTYTGVSATQTASGNGYYKCVFKFTGQVSGGAVYMSDVASPTSWGNYAVYQYAGDSSSSLVLSRFSLASTAATDYNATTTQIHREYAATLKSVAYSGQPRFEYEPTGDRSAKGLLIESSSSNLAPYSNNFGAWGATNVVAEAGASVGPDGQPCYVMREDSSAGVQHRLSQNVNGQAYSAAHTMSVYAKKVASSNQTRYLRLRVNGLSGEASVQFDLDNGTVVRTSGSQLDGQTIIPVGNGWYRLTMTYSNTATSRAVGMIITGSPDTTDTLPSYDGDGYTAFALFGAMVEEANFPSSYTATSSSTSTRTADSLSVATADIGYTGGPVSVVGEVRFNEATASSVQYLMHLSNGTGDDAIMVSRRNSGGYANKLQGYIESDNVDQGSIYLSSSTVTNNTNYKWAISVDTNDFKADLNGLGNGTSDAGVTLPKSASTLKIGAFLNSGYELDGYIKRVALYSEALTDTELQSLTS